MSYTLNIREKIATINGEQVVILTLNGALTLGVGCLGFKDKYRKLIQDGRRLFILDLAGIHEFDGSGIGELMTFYSETQGKFGQIILCHVPKEIASKLQAASLLDLFQIRSDVEEAVESLP